ncbi:MAG: methyltransferase domain-containing protein [Bacteroidetes bacterium]|nr:methyltransferase domain-containing protein [Bacteroidota bacterium]
MDNSTCPVCGSPLKLKYKLRFNVYECGNCGLLHSDAQFEHSFQSDLESTTRDVGLKNLRLKNFKVIISELQKAKTGELHGLEIGSGNGWWLETCKANSIDCTGIEPEHIYEEYHKKSGFNIVYGFYPDMSPKRQGGYDFIIFNDVFEHIPDINSLVESLKQDLADDGVLIINIPMSTGFFYRMAKLLHAVGWNSSLTRMWQFNFHSPHMNYFNEQNLKMLLDKHGFDCAEVFKLDSLDFSTVKERILSDRGMNKFRGTFIAGALSLMRPVIQHSEPDIKTFFFKKK